MPTDILLLTIAAAKIAFIHTLLGPDHYLPFVVMASARKWSMIKTSWVTLLCGLGHVAGSILLGLVGIAIGLGVNRMVGIETVRGELAAWLLVAFGLAYFVWGLRRAIKRKPHSHFHAHADGMVHRHEHTHHHEHSHVHGQAMGPWVLFVVFILGPCESLIPILIVPAASHSISGMIWVGSVFGGVTLITMLAMVLISTYGVKTLSLPKLERYSHAFAGATMSLCGLGILFFGL